MDRDAFEYMEQQSAPKVRLPRWLAREVKARCHRIRLGEGGDDDASFIESLFEDESHG